MNKSAQSTMNFIVLAFAFAFIALFLIPTSDAETVVGGNFAVTWHDCEYGLTKQLCYVDIQNLDPTSNQPFNLSAVISDTEYINSYSTDMTMYEWKALNTIIDTYNTTEINETRYNITYSPDNYTYTNETYYHIFNKTEVNGTETKKINQWKTTKSNMFKEGVREKMYYGSISIPKHKSKEKFDDMGDTETINGTKRFKVEWTTPITQLDGAWGSTGKIAFWDENTKTEYHPFWNTSWSNRAPIEINSTATLTDYQVAINITYNANMLSNFSDLRFTNENDVERPYWIESKIDSNWAYVWVKTDLTTANGTQLYAYYGNPTATSESNGNNTFIKYYDFEDGTAQGLTLNGGSNIQTGTVKTGTYALEVYDNDGAGIPESVIIPSINQDNIILEFDSYYTAVALAHQPHIKFGNNTEPNIAIIQNTVGTNVVQSYDGSWKDFTEGSYSPTNNAWTKWGLAYYNSGLKFWADDDYKGTGYFYRPYDTHEKIIFMSAATPFTGVVNYLDNIRIRKYTPNPPTYSIGAEESANSAPVVTNLTWATTSGDTDDTLTYLQTLDYIIVNSTDADADSLTVNLSVKNPNNVYTLTNVSMTQNGDFWNYTTDIELNLNGTWTIEIYSNDSTTTTLLSDTISVTKTTPSTFDGWFGYFTETIPTTSNITTLVTYDYDLIGIYDNFTNFETNWTAIKTAINDSKEQNVKSALSFYFDGDYSDTDYVDNVKNNITAEFIDLKSSPYTETVAMIIIELNSSGTETQKANFVNNISQKMANATTNLFPIYIKDFTSSQLDPAYTTPFTFPYNTYTTESEFINREITYLRDNTTLTRLYYDLSTTLKLRTQNYYNNIIHNIENIPTGNTTEDEFNIADIENDGVVLFNNESTQQYYIFNLTGRINDIWDRTNNEILEKNTDGNFSITLNAYEAAIIIFKDLNRFIYGSDYSTLYKVSAQENTYFNYTEGARSASWTVYGANDIKIELWDSSYGHNNQFMIHYEYINSSYVVDYSDYDIVIIADKNGDQINNSIGNLDKTYIYVSVADYEDTDVWQNAKQAEIESIINTYQTNIFIDGMDTGAMGTDFEIRIKAIADYIRINYGKNRIFNDYSVYLKVSDYGTADMKESFCGRWNESVNDPNYYYENISIDVARANWARTKNKQQLLMTFGDIDDMEKMSYCYAEYLVLYGTANNNTFKYGQPNFQTQREIYTKDVGIQLETKWTETTTNDWNRKFTKGTMHIDTVNHTWSFDDARSTSAELCFDLYNGAGTPSAAGPLRYTINMPNSSFDVSKVYNITYDEIASGSSGVWDTVCKPINAVDITQNGKYDIRVWCGSADGTSRCNTGFGFDVGNDLVEGTGVHSWYDSSAPNYPAVEGYGTVYGRDQSNNLTRNWNIYLNMNDTTSTSIDTVTTEINRSVTTTTTYLNITLDSSKDYNLTVVDNGTTMSIYESIKVWNTTAFETIYPIESSDCDSNNPTFNDTTINGESYGACTKTGANTFVRFSVPHLSEQIIQLAIDTTTPTISDFNLTNNTYSTVDLSENTTGIVYAEWNITDTNLNVSTCDVKYRAYDSNGVYYANWSFINDTLSSELDINGWNTKPCNFISGNADNTTIRVNMNLSDDNDWRPGVFNFDHEILSKDVSHSVFKNDLVKVEFHNVTTSPNTGYIFEFQVDEASVLTIIDFVVYACNSSYSSGDPRLSSFCVPTDAVHVGDSYDNLQYYDMYFTSDENGEFNGIKITDNMYGIGTNFNSLSANKGWDVWATSIECGDNYQSSIDAGVSWSNITGSCGNHHLHYFNGFQGEFKVTINDTYGNSISETQTDLMGQISNSPPALTLQTDEIQGSLPTVYSANNITETGTIWLNTTVSDPDQDNVTCSYYLLNNDSSLNKTILSIFELNASFGTCYYEWNLTNEIDGDYIIRVNVTDGIFNSTDELSSFMRIASDTTAPVISNIVERNIRYSTLDITWSTDESANSSISLSPTGTYSNSSVYTTSHSIAVSGLESNTNYAYTITSCDSISNCNTTESRSFTTKSASSSGGAGGCTPVWVCSEWSYCTDAIQTRTCIDNNLCGLNASMSELNQTCSSTPIITPSDNKTNFTLIDRGNYTWPWTPTDGVYHATRLAAVISSILAHNLDETVYNILASFGDYYHRPNFEWGILSILFMHITPFIVFYLLFGLLIRYSKLTTKSSKIIKFIVYGIIIPIIVLFITLLIPTV